MNKYTLKGTVTDAVSRFASKDKSVTIETTASSAVEAFKKAWSRNYKDFTQWNSLIIIENGNKPIFKGSPMQFIANHT